MAAPSILFGYRVTKHITAGMEVLYSFYKTDFEYVEELSNAFTNDVNVRTISYTKDIHTLSIGMGFVIELSPVRKVVTGD
jgi:hypothetical protein